MDQCEDRGTTLCGEQDRQNKAQSPEQQLTPESAGPGPEPEPEPGPEPGPGPGPGPGPEPEPSCVSMKIDWSKDLPIDFKDGRHSIDPRRKLEEPEPSCVSMKSDWSKDLIITFKDGRHSVDQRVDQEISEVPSGQSTQQHQTHLDSIFMVCTCTTTTFTSILFTIISCTL
ncbi:procyclic form-specific polypeptide B1-alpha-like [Sander lucioperca]|uniref:procyclic form-specific polypeptide B1-alpha-like n=1 Tax=Sander lucioperca TaxID=283035 RepID=UPI00165371F3|nr:procyclic form-specific polypeptide B1-alpha-like [Sander lucioperca]